MTEVDGSLIDEILKSMQGDMRDMKSDIAAMKLDLRSVKGHMASCMVNEIARDTALANLTKRVERIERRLDLTEGPA